MYASGSEHDIMAYRSIVPCLLALVACGGEDTIGRVVPPAPPTLSDVAVSTAEDTAVRVAVRVTASDPRQVVLSVATPPVHGTLTGTGPTWTYTPNANYTGADKAVVQGRDSHGVGTADIVIRITSVNDAPVANPDSFMTGFNAPLTVALAVLLANDTDADSDTLTVTAVAAVPDGHGTPVINGTNVVFTPEPGFVGTARFVYTVSDGTLTAQGNVTVTIGADQPPVAVDDAATTPEDVTLVISDSTLLANDTDADGQTLSISAVGNAVHGTVTHTGTQVTFVPDPNFHGLAGFDYTVTDGLLSDVGTVAVTVTSVNDAPIVIASPGAVAYLENAPALTIDGAIAVTDADNATLASATVQITSGCAPADVLALTAPPTGIAVAYTAATCTLALTGAAAVADYQAALRRVTYLNAGDNPGSTTRVVGFTVDDGEELNHTSGATREITVTPVDDAPVAVNDTATVAEDSGTTAVPVLANDVDPDGGPIAITAVTQPLNGVVVITGGGTGVTYTPRANYCNALFGGPDLFTYTLTPGGSKATVAITVTCSDDPPIAVADSATVAENTTANLINVLANDNDVDGGARQVASVTQPAHGTVVIGLGSASVNYTPAPGYCNDIPNGPRDTFTYTLRPGSSSATVSVRVTCACGLNQPTDFVVGSN